jgi:hypothetical protein
VQLAEAGLKQPTSAISKVVSAETIKALDAHRAAEANAGKTRAWTVAFWPLRDDVLGWIFDLGLSRSPGCLCVV